MRSLRWGWPLGVLFAALALALLASCPSTAACEVDSDCGGDVCARTSECLPARLVHRVRVSWTIRGAAADAASCASVEPLAIELRGDAPTDELRFEPLACTAGLFTVDKLPTRMDEVIITGPGVEARAGIPLDGEVTLNLR